jgi:hypothetical protein
VDCRPRQSTVQSARVSGGCPGESRSPLSFRDRGSTTTGRCRQRHIPRSEQPGQYEPAGLRPGEQDTQLAHGLCPRLPRLRCRFSCARPSAARPGSAQTAADPSSLSAPARVTFPQTVPDGIGSVGGRQLRNAVRNFVHAYGSLRLAPRRSRGRLLWRGSYQDGSTRSRSRPRLCAEGTTSPDFTFS